MINKERKAVAEYLLEKMACDNQMLMSLATDMPLNQDDKEQFVNISKCKNCVHKQECDLDQNTRDACIRQMYEDYKPKN